MKGEPPLLFEKEAKRLAQVYEGTTFSLVHPYLIGALPALPATVLDIGAGSGRDVAALAAMGYEVTAVEPSAAMRHQAKSRHPVANIEWLDDHLPRLHRLGDRRFDLVLLSAIWMYVARGDRPMAADRVRDLCAAGAVLSLSVRSMKPGEAGDFDEEDVDATATTFLDRGFRIVERRELPDILGRPHKSWTALVFRS